MSPWNRRYRFLPRVTLLEDRRNPSGHDIFAIAADTGGGPRVQVFNEEGQKIADFFAFDPGFTGGVFVASADTDDNGFDDIIVAAGTGGGPHVKVFGSFADGVHTDTPLLSFFAFDPSFTGGVRVAADDGIIAVAAGPGGGP